MTSPEDSVSSLSRAEFQTIIGQLSEQDPVEAAVKRFFGTLGQLPQIEGLALTENHYPRTLSAFHTTIFTDFKSDQLSATLAAIREADISFLKDLPRPRSSHVFFRNTAIFPLNTNTASRLQRVWQGNQRTNLLGFFVFKP